MRKSADGQRKRRSRAAAPKHPADPPRDPGSEPLRWSSSSHALLLPRSTGCSGSTLDRPYSNCNDGAAPDGSPFRSCLQHAVGASKSQVPGRPTELCPFADIFASNKLRKSLIPKSQHNKKWNSRAPLIVCLYGEGAMLSTAKMVPPAPLPLRMRKRL